jgi:hypothetical protein
MPPQDPTPGNRYRIQSKATGYQLGVPGPDGHGVYDGTPHIIPKFGGQGAIWEVGSADIGYRFKTNAPFPRQDPFAATDGTSTVIRLDIGMLDSNAERQVYAHKPNDGNYQKWRLFRNGEGYWQLINVATGLALDGTDQDIFTMRPNDGAYQRWAFLPA